MASAVDAVDSRHEPGPASVWTGRRKLNWELVDARRAACLRVDSSGGRRELMGS
jgi:hypothetical protein